MTNHEKDLLDLLENEKQAHAPETNEDDAVAGVSPHRVEWDEMPPEKKEEDPVHFSNEALKRMREDRTRILQEHFVNPVSKRHIEKTASAPETLLEQTKRVTGQH